MIPAAYITSRLDGRTRLKIPDRARDYPFFHDVDIKMADLDGVARVATNPLTASVLVEHDGTSLDQLAEFAESRQLFRLERGVDLHAVAREHTATVMNGEDRRTAELSAAVGVSMLGLAAYQAYRGKFLPAGMTLFFQALEFMRPAEAYLRRSR